MQKNWGVCEIYLHEKMNLVLYNIVQHHPTQIGSILSVLEGVVWHEIHYLCK
jgi:hypothetical protein